MKSLILGGVKSGKSRLAEQLANDTQFDVTVIATALAQDAEMASRIERHRSSRPTHWKTIEEPISVGSRLQELNHSTSAPTVVLDCITLWLTNLLMSGNSGLLEEQKSSLISAVEQFQGRLLMVSNETNMGIVPMGELSREFCDEAGLLHQALAERCEQVILCVAGLPHYIKNLENE